MAKKRASRQQTSRQQTSRKPKQEVEQIEQIEQVTEEVTEEVMEQIREAQEAQEAQEAEENYVLPSPPPLLVEPEPRPETQEIEVMVPNEPEEEQQLSVYDTNANIAKTGKQADNRPKLGNYVKKSGQSKPVNQDGGKGTFVMDKNKKVNDVNRTTIFVGNLNRPVNCD